MLPDFNTKDYPPHTKFFFSSSEKHTENHLWEKTTPFEDKNAFVGTIQHCSNCDATFSIASPQIQIMIEPLGQE